MADATGRRTATDDDRHSTQRPLRPNPYRAGSTIDSSIAGAEGERDPRSVALDVAYRFCDIRLTLDTYVVTRSCGGAEVITKATS